MLSARPKMKNHPYPSQRVRIGVVQNIIIVSRSSPQGRSEAPWEKAQGNFSIGWRGIKWSLNISACALGPP